MAFEALPQQLQEVILEHGLDSSLDEDVFSSLARADPDRALEVLEDLAGKSDVRNPSAFVAASLSKYPLPRGGNGGSSRRQGPGVDQSSDAAKSVYAVVDSFPEIADALDDKAMQRILEADPAHAEEILQDISAKGNVQNPSAFVMRAMSGRSQGAPRAERRQPPARPTRADPLDALLSRHPDIHRSLDDKVLSRLAEADLMRVEEILEDVSNSPGVRNPSAFIMKALAAFPTARSRQNLSPLDKMLASHPSLRDSLDDKAMAALQSCDPVRALEVVGDIVDKGDVRNPSAFVASSLAKYPHPRGNRGELPVAHARPVQLSFEHAGAHQARVPLRAPSRLSAVEKALSQHWRLRKNLDDEALQKLHAADPDRALEIIEDVAARDDVRNPSAFVVKALTAFSQRRGGHPEDSGIRHQQVGNNNHLDRLLSSYPEIYDALDEVALKKLQEAEFGRAQEIIQDIVARGDVHNPSAFVVKAIGASRTKRGRADVPQPSAAAKIRRIADGAQETSWGGHGDSPEQRAAAMGLDDRALRMLRSADQARASEVLDEVDAKRGEVRNPSAFVCKSLTQYPAPRGRGFA
eukprot:TRINITY_DN92924_c0_g1_i1.p1 TRINITY_DN92924_c0_g1~~TRINITY_DN92924_c0_g1_i1.p1  ORF type:complete len:580 (-),score=88.01 TRINITY_DN92924_c0_g1_i1:94-1833(-)